MDGMLKKLLILRTSGVGPVKYKNLLTEFGNDDEIIKHLSMDDSFVDDVKREMDKAHDMGIVYISDDDSRYPSGLRNVKNHPIVISVRGNVSTLSKKCVSIVGTRHSTVAGMNFVSELSESFANHNFAVVSGMAMGTDTAAHIGALKSQGVAQTIAVLAGGVDYIWPLENESIYYEILERGAVISEMPVGMKPNAQNFVQRNRWIAALSDIVIVGEADIKSGSMTTARFAKDFKKRIFAVPGHPSDARSTGPNSLIKSGDATLCMSVKDFFDDENDGSDNKNNKITNDILDKLGMIPVSESVLANLVKKNVSEIKSDLVILELQGLIRKQDGGYVLN